MTESVSVPESTSHRGIVIGAVATVLAAIIVSLGTIIAASRNRESLEEKIAQLQATIDATSQERDVAKRTTADSARQIQQLNAEVERLRGGEPKRALDPPPLVRPETVIASRSFKGFDVSLYGCVKDGGKVTCFFTVTNKEAERAITLIASLNHDPNSRAVDEARRELLADGAEFGSREGRTPNVTIPSESALDATIFFNVPASSQIFKVLQVVFSYEYNNYKAEFRDIALTPAE